jgi:hypothetical protein
VEDKYSMHHSSGDLAILIVPAGTPPRDGVSVASLVELAQTS